MTQAGYLSTHVHDYARAIVVRGDPTLFEAQAGRMLPLRPRLSERQLLLIRRLTESWACFVTHLRGLESGGLGSSHTGDPPQVQGASVPGRWMQYEGVTEVTDGLLKPAIQLGRGNTSLGRSAWRKWRQMQYLIS